MIQQVAERESSLKTIEALMRKYPDVPPVLVIKQDLLRLGVWYSDQALATAQAVAEKKSYLKFSQDQVPMSAMPGREYMKAPGNYFIKGGPYKLCPVRVYTTLAPNSPYRIDVIDGHLKLLLEGVPIADVGFRPAMKYGNKTFPDGTLYRDIISGGSTIVPFSYCQFWGAKEECKFCDINENARQVRQFKADTLRGPVKSVEQVVEVANEIAREVHERDGFISPITFSISSGTITNQLNGLTEDEFYLRYVEALKAGGPRRYVRLAVSAKDRADCKEYHNRGVDIPHFNLEVWDKRIFEWICPGKAQRVGWDQWVKRLVDAVDIFGDGSVVSTMVCGIEMAQPYGFKTVAEAVKSATEGVGFLVSHGVHPRFTPWMREPGSYLVKNYTQPSVPADFYLQLTLNCYENLKRYRLQIPPRAVMYGEQQVMGGNPFNIHEDFVPIMEQKDYENRALKGLEAAGIVWDYRPQDPEN
ncbi:MAG: hypothetical protein HY673_09340 [Chloroflexi bacterium]|nr:hypothetical protein [Chloroflexota bacterium]